MCHEGECHEGVSDMCGYVMRGYVMSGYVIRGYLNANEETRHAVFGVNVVANGSDTSLLTRISFLGACALIRWVERVGR